MHVQNIRQNAITGLVDCTVIINASNQITSELNTTI